MNEQKVEDGGTALPVAGWPRQSLCFVAHAWHSHVEPHLTPPLSLFCLQQRFISAYHSVLVFVVWRRFQPTLIMSIVRHS